MFFQLSNFNVLNSMSFFSFLQAESKLHLKDIAKCNSYTLSKMSITTK